MSSKIVAQPGDLRVAPLMWDVKHVKIVLSARSLGDGSSWAWVNQLTSLPDLMGPHAVNNPESTVKLHRGGANKR